MKDKALEQVAACLPREMRLAVLERGQTLVIEEIQLRARRGLFLTDPTGGSQQLTLGGEPIPVTVEDLARVVELATRSSFQTAAEKLKQGFCPLRGGHRLGLCGGVHSKGGEITGVRELSSINLRVARPVDGFADELVREVWWGQRVHSTLILSPPGCGKTTLLRDLIRTLSRDHLCRIGLADERGEVAALWRGVPQLEVGDTTDVLDGCPKAAGLLQLLRGMNPQVLAADEITAPEDVSALLQASNCGVSVLATAHCGTLDELRRHGLYRPLLEERVFEQVCLLKRADGGGRSYRVEGLKC